MKGIRSSFLFFWGGHYAHDKKNSQLIFHICDLEKTPGRICRVLLRRRRRKEFVKLFPSSKPASPARLLADGSGANANDPCEKSVSRHLRRDQMYKYTEVCARSFCALHQGGDAAADASELRRSRSILRAFTFFPEPPRPPFPFFFFCLFFFTLTTHASSRSVRSFLPVACTSPAALPPALRPSKSCIVLHFAPLLCKHKDTLFPSVEILPPPNPPAP